LSGDTARGVGAAHEMLPARCAISVPRFDRDRTGPDGPGAKPAHPCVFPRELAPDLFERPFAILPRDVRSALLDHHPPSCADGRV